MEDHFNKYLAQAAALEASLQIDQFRLLESQVRRIEKQIDGHGPEFPDYQRISQAAIGAVSFYPPVRAFYNKIRRRSGKHVARTVVAKELASFGKPAQSKRA